MKVTNLNSDKLVNLNTFKYRINWEKDGSSKLERMFRDLISIYWRNSIVLFQPRIPGSKLKLDFLNVNKRLCVETDGEQHNSFNKHFHNNSRNVYLASLNRDRIKEIWLEKNDIKLLRLVEEDLINFSPNYILNKFDIDIT